MSGGEERRDPEQHDAADEAGGRDDDEHADPQDPRQVREPTELVGVGRAAATSGERDRCSSSVARSAPSRRNSARACAATPCTTIGAAPATTPTTTPATRHDQSPNQLRTWITTSASSSSHSQRTAAERPVPASHAAPSPARAGAG